MKEFVQERKPEDITTINERTIAKVLVTVDGIWMKRGHNSKLSVMFIMSGYTGDVLDCIVKSLFCQTCLFYKNKLGVETEAFKTWIKSHEDSCELNQNSLPGKMETDGAVELFKRSINQRGLMYSTFRGDGDTDCYGTVKEECEKLGIGYYVVKEECVGHIQKRIGTALR